jgi:hydrogenase maturation protein HypF
LKQRAKITIKGAVQGVGFRPFVYRLAAELGIKGWIINSSQGVFIDAEAEEENLSSFVKKLKADKPKNAFIQSFEHAYFDCNGYTRFEIRKSDDEGSKTALVLPDISTCDDCLKEIFDPSDRRYLYPFTNCTNCGPRFSIIRDLPYDRANTTMAEFEMCEDCKAEYTNPLDRRFHAEPIACNVCGPKVTLWDENGEQLYEKHKAIEKSAEFIKSGKIVALKGIGGFQLLADARDERVISELRKRKRRSEKPFAVMFPDIEAVKSECELSAQEESLLFSVESPIVLLKRKSGIKPNVAPETAIGNPYLGVMLPYSPLHHILMRELKIPVIATSGNISEEPICIDETQALEKLNGIADYFLVHNRKILRHVDDSIARIAGGREMIIRRARGYAPLPVVISGLNEPVLAVGAHLKNTIAVNKNNNVFISQHIGDLENIESINAFKKVTNDLQSFYEIKPEKIICDLHPDYISTKYAKESGEQVIQLQHHYAHVLSCMAENNIDGEILGVSWDGTGYGTDGTIWGGEFIIPQGRNFKRAAYLKPFRLPGGEKAIYEVWRTGFALLYEVFGDGVFALKNTEFIKKPECRLIKQMLDKNINSPLTSSIGRLFDGVAAVIGIRDRVSFEAQVAMELEFLTVELIADDYYNFEFEKNENDLFVINWHQIIKDIVKDLENNIPKNLISVKFHNTLAEIIIRIACKIKLEKVLLAGGCFQNKYLLERAIKRLKQENYKVYWHQRVPANDGGISPGQIKYSTYFK